MAFIIIMSNPGGEIERRTAKDGDEAADVLSDMVLGMELCDGDTFVIVEEDKEQT